MLEALHNNPALVPLLPFVRTFCGRPTSLWEDEVGDTQEIPQGEGSEQGDSLVPALYALGTQLSPHVDTSLHEGEMLFAFLNDIYILCDPSRVGEIFLQVKQSLARFAGVQVNLGKTKVWNRAATRPIHERRVPHVAGPIAFAPSCGRARVQMRSTCGRAGQHVHGLGS